MTEDEKPDVQNVVDLEKLSVDELEERIHLLRKDIECVEAEIMKKKGMRRAANALFGGKPPETD